MAVPFYVPEGGPDSSASGSSDGSSSSSSHSPNTTTSATQTPLQSPVNGEHLVMAFCEALYRCSIHSASPVFQYPPPPSPSCSVHSPAYAYGEVFFPRGRSTPRTPRTSVSFGPGEEISFPHRHQPVPPQSAPPMSSQHAHQHQPHQQQHFYCHPNYPTHCHQFTPPPTPTLPMHNTTLAPAATSLLCATSAANQTSLTTSTVSSSTTANTVSSVAGSATTHRLHRSHSDAARRSRLTTTGEDERECQSEHETSWDEFDERFDNFTAGRERLQEFNGRIPPRKKKKEVPKSKPEKKEQSFTWPTVVTVFVVAMGCGFLVAR